MLWRRFSSLATAQLKSTQIFVSPQSHCRVCLDNCGAADVLKVMAGRGGSVLLRVSLGSPRRGEGKPVPMWFQAEDARPRSKGFTSRRWPRDGPGATASSFHRGVKSRSSSWRPQRGAVSMETDNTPPRAPGCACLRLRAGTAGQCVPSPPAARGALPGSLPVLRGA